jgi:hypothetical protein
VNRGEHRFVLGLSGGAQSREIGGSGALAAGGSGRGGWFRMEPPHQSDTIYETKSNSSSFGLAFDFFIFVRCFSGPVIL